MNENKQYYVFYFILFFAWSSVYTLVAIYLSEEAGFKLAEIGTLMSFLPIITLVFQPIWGALSDRTDHKKRLLSGIMGVNLILALMMTFFTSKLAIILVYCLYTVFLCAQSPMTDAMAIAYVNRTKQGSYGSIRAWGSAGYAIGSMMVAQIVFYMGLKSIFYIAALGFIVSLFLLSRIKEHKIKVSRTHYLKDLGNLLKRKEYVFILVYSFLFSGSFFGGEQYLGLYFRWHGIPVSKIGFLTFIAVCVEVPFIFYSKRLIRSFGIVPLMLLMNCVSILRMGILSFGNHWGIFIISSILRGVIVGIFIPLFIEVISSMTPKALSTSAISIYSAVSSGIATFTFTLLGGFLADQLGYPFLYGTYGFVALLPLILVLLFRGMLSSALKS
ncbi:MFS transporter [Fusibacter sp. 3D3]|uniref:MFS transporter n=1 Tax=Fusibacter sp. 3D3 TaxID=1048380 RepID=UPI000852E376|nr:MFS transporter [Fusibacter sp. 3D3]GAU76313.1 probable 3-phenylpropionic acid transporter [Fusibacter sp. 3D3]